MSTAVNSNANDANINPSSTQEDDVYDDVVVNVDGNDNKCGTSTDHIDASDTNINGNAERYKWFFSSSCTFFWFCFCVHISFCCCHLPILNFNQFSVHLNYYYYI